MQPQIPWTTISKEMGRQRSSLRLVWKRLLGSKGGTYSYRAINWTDHDTDILLAKVLLQQPEVRSDIVLSQLSSKWDGIVLYAKWKQLQKSIHQSSSLSFPKFLIELAKKRKLTIKVIENLKESQEFQEW